MKILQYCILSLLFTTVFLCCTPNNTAPQSGIFGRWEYLYDNDTITDMILYEDSTFDGFQNGIHYWQKLPFKLTTENQIQIFWYYHPDEYWDEFIWPFEIIDDNNINASGSLMTKIH